MALTQECGKHSRDKQEQQPRRKQHDGDRQRHRGDDLLHQAADGLDHTQAIGGLDASPLQAIVEDRVLVGDQIKLRGVLHHADADVAHVLFGQKSVEIIDDAAEDAAEHSQPKFSRH